jgi:aminopeptidase N
MNTVCAGFAAGNFDELEIPTDDVYKFKHMNIFCRKSQIEKCQKVGFDLKEIISKAMKFLDTYFDNTINVNKFNLIFLPFTKYPALELATCPLINEEWLFSYENDFLFEIKRAALIIQ